MNSTSLYLYEEIMLLALRDQKGTVATSYSEYAIAGAVMAELLLDHRISVDETKKKLVTLHNPSPMGDPIIDECLKKLTAGKRRAPLQKWVARLADIKELRHKAARQLCDRGILRADQQSVLLIFKRRIYPEINPLPEKKIIDRLRSAIFEDHTQVDSRTVVLVSLANAVGLIEPTFGRKNVRGRKKRIEQIIQGEVTGKATKEIVAACEAAVLAAAIMPGIVASTSG